MDDYSIIHFNIEVSMDVQYTYKVLMDGLLLLIILLSVVMLRSG